MRKRKKLTYKNIENAKQCKQNCNREVKKRKAEIAETSKKTMQ